MNVLNQELRLKQFEDTLDALIEMKEQARSESEDGRIDDEIAVLILRFVG